MDDPLRLIQRGADPLLIACEQGVEGLRARGLARVRQATLNAVPKGVRRLPLIRQRQVADAAEHYVEFSDHDQEVISYDRFVAHLRNRIAQLA